MCQLLGMNSNKPASLSFSFAGFAERGGRTGEHSDGWGIAFHNGAGCQLIVEHMASVVVSEVDLEPAHGLVTSVITSRAVQEP